MNIGATVPFWSVVLGQQGGLGAALDAGLEITAASADDFLIAQAQLMAGLEEAGVSEENLLDLATAAIKLREVVSGEKEERHGVVVTHRSDLIKQVLRTMAIRLARIDHDQFSTGRKTAQEKFGFGLAAGARLFASGETVVGAAREAWAPRLRAGRFANLNLFRRIDELDISTRLHNCLTNAGIVYVFQLVQKTETELLEIREFNQKTLRETKDILAEWKLYLGMMRVKNFSVEEAEAYRSANPAFFTKK